MQPVPAAASWDVPAIESEGALSHWLGLLPTELDWFAELKRLGFRRAEARFRHYYYRVVLKPAGGVRLIEAPKTRLRRLQRQILAEILEKVPMHRAVHGFLKDRSIKTFVAPHVGRRVVLRMDLQDCRKALRRRPCCRIFVRFAWIAGWPVWRKLLGRSIRDMRTIVRHERKGPRRAQCV